MEALEPACDPRPAATVSHAATTDAAGEVEPSLPEVPQRDEAGSGAKAGDGNAEEARGKQDDAQHRDEDGDAPTPAPMELLPLHNPELQAQLQPEASEASSHSGTRSADTDESQEHLAGTADEPAAPAAGGKSQEHPAGTADEPMAPAADGKHVSVDIEEVQVPLFRMCCGQSRWC